MNLVEYFQEVASILKVDYPVEFQEALNLLNSDTALIAVDHEKVLISVRDNRFQFSKPDETRIVDLEAFITKSLLFKLLDGKTTLADAIFGFDFVIKGNIEAVLRFFNIVEIVLRISQGSPSFIELLNRFRYGTRT